MTYFNAKQVISKESRCLTIVTYDYQLDLQAFTEEERDYWYDHFSRFANQNISNPFNFQHMEHVGSDFTWDNKPVEDTFELIELIGKGAYGSVFRGFHKISKRLDNLYCYQSIEARLY